MKVKKYSLLYFHHLIDKYSKWIFPLHDGENIIGSDKNVDIFLYLDENIDKIESIHCKIIVDEYQNYLSIISLSDINSVQKEENENKIDLLPGKQYTLVNKSVFYLGKNLKFIVINDTMEEIYNYFIEQRLENEFQKWKELISYHENNVNIKISLNLTRKDSLNKSNVSIKSNNNNTNLLNNNNLSNNNNNNSLLNSNNKDINRIGFNNFDEVPDDNWLNDNENINEKNNLDFSDFKPINNPSEQKYQNSIVNTVKFSFDETPKISPDIPINENNINIDNIFRSKEPKIQNNFEQNLINSNNISNNNIIQEKYNENNNNNLPLFKNTNINDLKPLKNKFHEEKMINKDEKTQKLIKELLGENNLEIIINNTNLKKIKKFDVYYKKANKAKIDMGNSDIKFKNKSNIFGNN